MCAGRPFFIRIGVSQASDAPAVRRVQDSGPQPWVQIVDVGLELDRPAAAGSGELAQDEPDDVRQLAEVAPAGAVPTRSTRIAGSVVHSVTR